MDWVREEALIEKRTISNTEGPERFQGMWRFYNYTPFACHLIDRCWPFKRVYIYEGQDEKDQAIYTMKEKLKDKSRL